MKIYDEHGAQVGELKRPEPKINMGDGLWYEAVAFRKPLKAEIAFDEHDTLYKSEGCSFRELWIASVIPRPTPEQLAAIGMKERDDRPVECKDGDKIWWNGYNWPVIFESEHIGKPRWVLVPAEKETNPDCSKCARKEHGKESK